MHPLKHFFPSSRLIAAHRGYRACYPENTLCAFNAAIDRCDLIETDIRLSSDGTPVIIHDNTVRRTSDGQEMYKAGKLSSMLVSELPLSQLQQLDMGSWFLEADPFATITEGRVAKTALGRLMPQRILTLDELLRWALKTNMFLNLEIKDLDKTTGNTEIVDTVFRAIYEHKAEEIVLVSSFNHQYLKTCRSLNPALPTALLIENQHPPDLINYLTELGCCAYHPNDEAINDQLITTLTDAGFLVNVYTVNDKQRQQHLYNAGVTAIFTDFL